MAAALVVADCLGRASYQRRTLRLERTQDDANLDHFISRNQVEEVLVIRHHSVIEDPMLVVAGDA